MTGIGHVIIGATTTFTALQVAYPELKAPELAGAFAVGAIASLTPDLDGDRSLLKAKIYGKGKPQIVEKLIYDKSVGGGAILAVLGLLEVTMRMVAYTLLSIPSLLLSHRGLTHYPSTALVLGAVIYLTLKLTNVSQSYALAFTIGYLSHLSADALTKTGVPLLAPFTKRRFHLLPKPIRITTRHGGSVGEALVILAVFISCALIVQAVTGFEYRLDLRGLSNSRVVLGW